MDDNNSNKKSCLNNYKLHLTILFISIISLSIGTITIHLYDNVDIMILPFIPALFIAISFYLIRSINWINYNQ